MPDLIFLDFIELLTEKLTIADKYMSRQIRLFIHQTKLLSKITCLGEKAFAVMFLYKSAEVHSSTNVT